MRALVYEGPRIMNVREAEAPEPGEGEVLIQVERAGICGSELSGYLGHNSLRKPPLIMGHEFSGVVERLGSGCESAALSPGDRVTANPLVSCGKCRACTNGAAQLCAGRQLAGAHRPGAFAEYVAVPATNVHRLEDHVSFDEGAFAEPFACAVHVCRKLKLRPTDRLLIMGAGPIGLLTLQAAQAYGLRHVAVADLNDERLSIAAELGAAAGMSVQALAGGDKFDAAVDAVGAGATRRACVEFVKPGGRVVFTGLHEEESSLPLNLLVRSETQVTGAFAYHTDDFETALQWIGEGRVRLLPWTIHAPLEEGRACFERLISGPGRVAKILLTL
ncbi:alcohol dehydrogenase [Gordoniibacillus kamchatkensis]|uniref:Alcohol dehydrogenase n=1 Tax=Gordoniibacillus kamchatkensis TaxID=1590651 RepID=A0ABR5AIW9_9BACL|nr:alcohol dehydrogenase catalytic domain-containing protein [Paenibacillus sp. VKM B-2647]KIL40997.1 alcohol dehydrogenase [Paenibacillus sp. VKM B-2647]